MRQSTKKLVAIVMLQLALGAMVAAGQQRNNPQPPKQDPQESDDRVVLRADLVHLDVTVVDSNNKPVVNLKKEEFQVFEDKVPQKVEFFTREQVPVSLVLTIDTSGSMKSKLDTVIKASINLVKQSGNEDELALIEFKDEPELLEEFTTNVNDIVDTLQGLIGSGQTAMLDALYLASDYAHKEGKHRRKAVVLVSDGLDVDSYYRFDDVVSRLRELDVQIYLVGFTGDLSNEKAWVFKKSEKDKAENLLNRLAADTGGRAFFPRELSEVHTIAQQISTDLRTQYSIGYYPTNTKRDGSFRSVRVQVNSSGHEKLVARTRAGYVAPRDADQRPADPKHKPER